MASQQTRYSHYFIHGSRVFNDISDYQGVNLLLAPHKSPDIIHTKALSVANHDIFVQMAEIEDQTDLLAIHKREEELKDTLVKHKVGTEYNVVIRK